MGGYASGTNAFRRWLTRARPIFVPLTTGVPQIGMTVPPADAAGLVVGKVYKLTALEDSDDPS